MTKDFVSTSPNETRDQVIDLMRARQIHQVPVVDRGQVVGLHTLDRLIGNYEKPNVAVLMAGGRGARLHPITDATPKPMLSVAGRPILERLVLHLVGWGIRTVYISINYLGDQIAEHFEDGSRFGCSIEYLRERDPLGTGGALSMLPPLEDPVIVMNGDLITQVDIDSLLRTHAEGGFVATMAVRSHVVDIPFGVVETEDDRMIRLVEKPRAEQLVNAGIYVLDPEIVDRVPTNAAFPITDLFETALARDEPVGVYVVDEDWIDVGRPTELFRAKGLI
jgi:NDP-sugar pyrophosphorylase family protein